ncbi:GNAT family N-acetyltransferase [soil metagenome]
MSDIVVTDNREALRFEAHLDAELVGIAEYQLRDGVIELPHTEVYVEGRGIGSALARYALDAVRADGTRAVYPVCPFIKSWIDKHPDYADLVVDRG